MTLRLDAQMRFLMEADRLKTVQRANVLMDISRPENSAEHSWHLCLYAIVLGSYAPKDADLSRVISMLLLHDLVEIDAGDMPIDQPHDAKAHQKAEEDAAKRLFALLPSDQAADLSALWHEFELGQSADARFAKQLDHLQPVFQVLQSTSPLTDHVQVVRDNLTTGRAARLATEWPEMHQLASDWLVSNNPTASEDLLARLTFLAEADRLKSVNRATLLADASRRENSAEHSWHIALHAFILGEHAAPDVTPARVVNMLLLHDLVEIDAGDNPIFGNHDPSQQEVDEIKAAKRLFGLLPPEQSDDIFALWQEFESNRSADAMFGKSLDRFSPPNQNLASGGGSWVEYDVSYDTFVARVGEKIANGAPRLWDWLQPKVRSFFTEELGR